MTDARNIQYNKIELNLNYMHGAVSHHMEQLTHKTEGGRTNSSSSVCVSTWQDVELCDEATKKNTRTEQDRRKRLMKGC